MVKILLAFSWGHQFTKPGFSNEVMAKEISKIVNYFDYVVIQIEIYKALKSFNIKPDYSIGKPGVYINTFDVASEINKWLISNHSMRSNVMIEVICHKTHWAGHRLILNKLKHRPKELM